MPLVFTVIYFKNSRTTFKLHKSSQTFRDEFQHSPFQSKKKKNNYDICVLNRRRWAPTVAD